MSWWRVLLCGFLGCKWKELSLERYTYSGLPSVKVEYQCMRCGRNETVHTHQFYHSGRSYE